MACFIDFDCNQQKLKRTDQYLVAEGVAGVLFARFALCHRWDGLTVYVRFERQGEVYDVPLADGVALVPREVCRRTGFNVALWGEDASGARLTSAAVWVPVAPGIDLDGIAPVPATPSLVQHITDIAQSVRDDADAGLFIGPPGPQGEGVPSGGTAGQVVVKTDTGTEWHTLTNDDFTGVVPITKGGTGAADEMSARQNLCVIGQNPIADPSGDTVAAWAACGTGVAFIHSAGHITDQPSEYGLVINSVFGTEVHQIWQTQANGSLYHRGGNASGWDGTWKEIATVEGIAAYLPWSIENGGTGATTAADARANLGAAASSHTHAASDVDNTPTTYSGTDVATAKSGYYITSATGTKWPNGMVQVIVGYGSNSSVAADESISPIIMAEGFKPAVISGLTSSYGMGKIQTTGDVWVRYITARSSSDQNSFCATYMVG